jgi:hypothetical protein
VRTSTPEPEPGDALALMRLHVETLYVLDAQGRLLRENEPSGGRAPRLFLGRTGAGHELRFRADVDADLVAELTDISEVSRRGPDATANLANPTCADALVQTLAARAPVDRIWTGPAYASHAAAPARFDDVVAIDARNAELLEGGLEAWLPDVPHRQPFLAVIEHGRAIALCASVRITDAAHEAGVETVSSDRRRGHASRAAAAWIAAVRALGATPLYSTHRDNAASRALAHRLGLRQFGVDFHVT